MKHFLRNLLTGLAIILPSLVMAQTGSWSDATNRNAAWPANSQTAGGKVQLTISSEKDFAQMAWLVNNEGHTFADTIIILAKSLDLRAHLWEPVGSVVLEKPFNGTFNGNDQEIDGLVVDKNGETGISAGLFGYTDWDAKIQDLTLSAPKITGAAVSSNVYLYSGGFVGINCGTLHHCRNIAGDSTGFIAGTANELARIGGLVGLNIGKISFCYNECIVKDSLHSHIGSLVGENDGSISQCYSTGAVTGSSDSWIGGLAGYNVGSISQCYSTGAVAGGSNSDIGGLVGMNDGSISYCLSVAPSISGTNADLHRIAGYHYAGILTGNYAWAGMTGADWTPDDGTGLNGANWNGSMAGAPIVNGTADWDPTVWEIDPTNQLMPKLSAFTDGQADVPNPAYRQLSGSGTEQDPFLIQTRADLDSLSAQVDKGNSYEGKFIRLAPANNADTLHMGATPFEPIGKETVRFNGSFNGNGKVIDGLVVDKSKERDVQAGLFGYTDKKAMIQNLTLSAPKVTGGASRNTNYSNTGGLVGYNAGELRHCRIIAGDGTGFIARTANDYASVGGLAGENWGEIISCYNECIVKDSLYSDIGGLVGVNNGSISQCYSTGTVTGGAKGNIGGLVGWNYSSISQCYSTGAVTGGSNNIIGGLVGGNDDSISYCLSVASSISETSNFLHRIVGYNPGAPLTGNYAWAGTAGADWTPDDGSGLNGADWNGSMADAPIGNGKGRWDTSVWEIDSTNQLIPKLRAFTDGQADVPNPAYRQPASPELAPENVYVYVSLEGVDAALREQIGLNPVEGRTEVEKGKMFELRVWLNQNTDLSALEVTADSLTLQPVRIEEPLPTDTGALRSAAWTSERVYVYEITPSADLQIRISGIRWNAGSNPTGIEGLSNSSQGGAKVYTTPGRIVIAPQPPKGEVRIYTITGQLVFSSPLGGGRVGASVPRGAYIVAVDGQRWKVIVN